MPAILKVVLSALARVGVKLILASITEKMLARLVFTGLERLSKQTDSEVDDKLLAELKDSYYGISNSEVDNVIKK